MKFAQHNKIYQLLSEQIIRTLKHLDSSIEITADEIYPTLSPPPKANMGDIAFGCFILAKKMKQAPNQLANSLQEHIASEGIISEAKAFGPYLNFYLNPAKLNSLILEDILDGKFFENELTVDAPKTIIEYSQPNTHKEMHVGHMRNLCLGNALVNLYRYANIETISTTFPGDVGTHVAKCLWYYKKHNSEAPPQERKGAWLGTLYTKGNNLLESQIGTPQADTNREELTEILKQLHAQSGEYYELWQETKAWSVELMQEVYKWANVDFDSWYWESDVDADSVALVKQYYEKGIFVKDDGAIGIDLTEDKLGFCLLLKSDGTGLYATKDLELARRKFEDQHVEQSIYVVDNRQALHFKQVFKTLEIMGFENAKNCYHLQYEMVELPDGAMSSRKGNIVPIQTLIDQMVAMIKTSHLSKYQGEWQQSEIDLVANQVAAGAIKYGMTKVDSNKKIVFDMNEWLKLDGESGPYIQYVYARINSLLNKLGEIQTPNYAVLTHELERELILKLSTFNTVIETCLKQNKTHPLCGFLYEVAKAFNSFYAECSVINAGSDDLKFARASLCEAVALSLAKGLSLLGIEGPKRM